MYKILSILILLSTTMCYGQGRYKVCKIYYEDSRDTSLSGLKTLQLYNTYGKIVFEKEYGQEKHTDNGQITDYRDTSVSVSMQYYYYDNDTILRSAIQYYYSFMFKEDNTACITKAYYYYNNSKLLTEKREVSYAHHTHGGCLPDDYKSWGDTTINYYKYDSIGNLILDSLGSKKSTDSLYLLREDNITHGINSMTHLKTNTKHIIPATRFYYDDKSRLVARKYAHEYYPQNEDYVYTSNGYLKLSRYNDGKADTTIVTYKHDNNHRIIEVLESNTEGSFTIQKTYGYFPDKLLLEEVETYKPGEQVAAKRKRTFITRYVYE